MAKQEITLYSRDAFGKVVTKFYPKADFENPTGPHKAAVLHLKSKGFSPVKIEDKPATASQKHTNIPVNKPSNPTTGSGSGSPS